jgi:hypothetical protein
MCLYEKDLRFDTYQLYRRKRISAFIIGQIMIQTGRKYVWIWITISKERNMFVAENLFDPLSPNMVNT